MKKFLSMILLAGMLAGPLYGAGQADWASMADAPVDKLSMAVYNAVKENPDEAAEIVKKIAESSTAWDVSRAYAVLRAVLLASPSLESGFTQSAAAYLSSGQIAGTGTIQGSELVNALVAADAGVAAAVMQSVTGAVATMITGPVTKHDGANEDASMPVVPIFPVTPTPSPTSPNN